MKKIYQSIASWQFLLAFIVFIAVLGTAYIYREQITVIILVPILYLLWVVDLALQMFGQQCIWVLALSIALILSYVFSRRNDKPVKGLDRTVRTVYGRRLAFGRIQFWRREISRTSKSINRVSFRRSEIRQLVVQTLVYRENTNPRDIEEKLSSEQIRFPAGVSNFLGLTDQTMVARQSIGLLGFIKLRIGWIIEFFVSPKYSPDPRIEMVAEYLENIMEIDDDARNY